MTEEHAGGGPLPVVRAGELPLDDAEATWLVEDLWARAGVGVIGGAPKCCKSWLGLDLALSVASATPCLGRFAVTAPGPVLLYLAEDAPAVVRARLAGLCAHRRLDLGTLPLHVITTWSLRLDLPRDQRRLEDAVAHLRPRLLLLDPFVRLHRIDENSAADVSALLGYLRGLQREHDLAVIVVHHARKNGPGGLQAGQALRGSGDFHAWGDSNLYLRRTRERLVLSVEHRAARAPDSLSLLLRTSNEVGIAVPPHLDVVDDPAAASTAPAAPDIDEAIVAALQAAGAPLARGTLRAQLRVRNERLGDALVRLAAAGRLTRSGDLWSAVPGPLPIQERGNGTSTRPERQLPTAHR
jgi:hypothetical protein